VRKRSVNVLRTMGSGEDAANATMAEGERGGKRTFWVGVIRRIRFTGFEKNICAGIGRVL